MSEKLFWQICGSLIIIASAGLISWACFCMYIDILHQFGICK